MDLYAVPDTGGLADTLARLWRRKWLIATTTVVVVVAALVVTLSLTPRYDAETRLRIGVPEAQLMEMSPSTDRQGINTAEIESEQHVLTSRELAARVVDRLALDRLPEFNPRLREPGVLAGLNPRFILAGLRRDAASPAPEETEHDTVAAAGAGPDDRSVEGDPAPAHAVPVDPEKELVANVLLSSIDAQPLGRSHVIALRARSADPVLAAEIANTLGEVYLEEKVVRRAESVGSANKWLSRHIENLRAELEKSERAVEAYRREHALYASRSDTITSQQLAELNTQVIAAQAKMSETQTRLQQALSTLKSENPGGTMPEVLGSPLIQALKQQQSTIERRQAELSTKYGRKHPTMLNIAAEKKDIDRRIRSEIENIISGLRNEAAAAKARYQAFRSNLEETKNAMGKSKAETIQLRALEREADANRALFQQFLQRVKETDVQKNVEASNSRIISRATVPGAPSFPPVNMLLALAVIGGILLGVVLALIVEQLDNTFRTDDDVERQTSLPTLAVVPKMSRRRLRDDHVIRKPTSAFSESIRRLEMSLRLDSGDEPGKIVMMASSVANEGKSGISLSLAKLAAAAGRNVILIDCDWRRPQLHTMVGRRNRSGVGELLAGTTRPEDVVYRDSSGAHLIFAGKSRPRHAHLITSDRMKYLLTSLSNHYDLVLIDTPPVLVGAEVMHLARLVDQAIYVVRWGSTRRDVVLKGLRQLAAMGAPLAGTVLSRVDMGRYRRYVRYAGTYDYRTTAVSRTG